MVKGICVFSISLMLLTSSLATAQDTVTVPLHFRAGFDIAGPLLKAIDRDLISYGALASADLNETFSAVGGIRYSSFSTSQYSYDYKSRGLTFIIGADKNFIKPRVMAGKYYAGIGLRYGLTFYGQEASRIEYTNPWGTGLSTLPLTHHTGHFLELSPGVRAELFKGVTIGWNLSLRLKLSSGAGSHLKPVYMPGFGDGSSGAATGASYFVSVTIPYKKIKVIIKPKVVSESEEGEGVEQQSTTTGGSGAGGRF